MRIICPGCREQYRPYYTSTEPSPQGLANSMHHDGWNPNTHQCPNCQHQPAKQPITRKYR